MTGALLCALGLAACGSDQGAAADHMTRDRLIDLLTANGYTEDVAACAADTGLSYPLDTNDAATTFHVVTNLTTCRGVEATMAACATNALSDAVGGFPTLEAFWAGEDTMTPEVNRKYLEGMYVCRGLDPTEAHCIVNNLQPRLIEAALAPGPNPQELLDRVAELRAACA